MLGLDTLTEDCLDCATLHEAVEQVKVTMSATSKLPSAADSGMTQLSSVEMRQSAETQHIDSHQLETFAPSSELDQMCLEVQQSGSAVEQLSLELNEPNVVVEQLKSTAD